MQLFYSYSPSPCACHYQIKLPFWKFLYITYIKAKNEEESLSFLSCRLAQFQHLWLWLTQMLTLKWEIHHPPHHFSSDDKFDMPFFGSLQWLCLAVEKYHNGRIIRPPNVRLKDDSALLELTGMSKMRPMFRYLLQILNF